MMTTANPLTTLLGGQPTPPLLTHAQEISLARRVAGGRSAHKQLTRRDSLPSPNRRALRQRLADGLAAREALVLHNLPLVLSVAGRFRNPYASAFAASRLRHEAQLVFAGNRRWVDLDELAVSVEGSLLI